jgi:hypothetical protein
VTPSQLRPTRNEGTERSDAPVVHAVVLLQKFDISSQRSEKLIPGLFGEVKSPE